MIANRAARFERLEVFAQAIAATRTVATMNHTWSEWRHDRSRQLLAPGPAGRRNRRGCRFPLPGGALFHRIGIHSPVMLIPFAGLFGNSTVILTGVCVPTGLA
jgi:hypothetical protein